MLTTDGIVLRTREIGKADRTAVILTSDYGVIDAFANGSKNPKSKLVAVAQPFAYSSFTLSVKKNNTSISSGNIKKTFFGIREDIDKLSLAFYFSELTQTIAPKNNNAQNYIKLLLNVLYYLENDIVHSLLLKPIYELRLLAMSGYMPDLLCCAECGKFDDDSFFFYPQTGDIRCKHCADMYYNQHSNISAVHISKSALSALRHIIYSDISKLFKFDLVGNSLIQLRNACENFVLQQTEQKFQTLDFYKTICN